MREWQKMHVNHIYPGVYMMQVSLNFYVTFLPTRSNWRSVYIRGKKLFVSGFQTNPKNAPTLNFFIALIDLLSTNILSAVKNPFFMHWELSDQQQTAIHTYSSGNLPFNLVVHWLWRLFYERDEYIVPKKKAPTYLP